MKPAPYWCERCLDEQRLTLHDLILLTSAGKPLRCARTGCGGRAYLAASTTAQEYMRRRDRSVPIPGARGAR